MEVTPVNFDELAGKENTESSESIRKRVVTARTIQLKRFENSNTVFANAQMESNKLREVCSIGPESVSLLKTAMDKLGLSARAYDRILKVSRTIADLANSLNIEPNHIAEAIQYRSLDRENWAG